MSIKAMDWAWEQPISNPGKKFVLVTLANFADGDGSCYPGQKRLAAMTGQTDRTVRSHLKQLEGEGYISRSSRFRGDGSRSSDLYQINWKNQPPENISAPTGKTFQGGRKKTAGQPEKISGHEPSVNRQSNPQLTVSLMSEPEKPHPKHAPPSEYGDLYAAWNSNRGALPECINNATVNKQLKTVTKTYDHADLLALITQGAQEVASDPFWLEKRYGLSNLLRNLDSKAEAFRSRNGVVKGSERVYERRDRFRNFMEVEGA